MNGSPVFTLVTGATRGIGRAIVDDLVARGRPVVGIARRADPSFKGPLLLADLADPEASRQVLAEATEGFAFDCLVNNAGFNHLQRLGDITTDAYDQIMALNVRIAVDCAQAVLPGMRAGAHGRIINISSRSALGRIEGSIYSAAKAALIGLTRSWALELAADGITVNCVAPGPVETEMFSHNNPPGHPRTLAMTNSIPMRRMGRPAEVAAAVAYFLSDAAAFTTGQTLFVCGGASIAQIHL